MPQHKSAEKRVKTNERDRQSNVANRSRLRGAVTAQRALPAGEEQRKALPMTVSEIDRAAKNRIIPARRADRLKSRLARQANKG